MQLKVDTLSYIGYANFVYLSSLQNVLPFA